MKKSVLYDAREYAKFWFSKVKGTAYNASPSFGTYFLDYIGIADKYAMENPQVRFRGLPKDQLQCAFEEYLELSAEAERMDVIRKFDNEVEDLTELDKWLVSLTGIINNNDRAVMAHWLWTVKRKAKGLPVKHQIMPILYGLQGGGKSMALTKLISPLERFRMNTKMEQLGDERTYQGYSQYLIVLFDELQGIERTDLNILKNQITTEKNTYRKLRTHEMVSVPMSCSFIGATNKHINESFSDSTGMRRFYEIPTLKTADWATINEIDYFKLWKGIDEKLNNGYLTGEVLQVVQKAQVALVNEDDVDAFIREHNMSYNGTEFKSVSATGVFRAYQEWAASNGLKNSLNKIWLCRKLINREVPSYSERDSRGIERRLFKVSNSCTILELAGDLISMKKGG